METTPTPRTDQRDRELRDPEFELYDRYLEMRDHARKLETELTDLQATFDLMFAADRDATEAWAAANPGNDLVWPDRRKLVRWLLDESAALRAAILALPDLCPEDVSRNAIPTHKLIGLIRAARALCHKS